MSYATRDTRSSSSHPFLITFSGIDGAGKSTQIEFLSSFLKAQGLRVLRLSFWDDSAVWPRLRSSVGQRAAKAYQSDQSDGQTFEPRNHKHVRRWYWTVARAGLYILDVARLRRLLGSWHIRNSDVVVFDRYIYDQLANLYSRTSITKTYIRAVLKQTPHPDLAFILDSSPDEAFARKPEYPLDFVYQNRRAFLRLREFSPELITIPPAGVEVVKAEILAHICRSRLVPFKP